MLLKTKGISRRISEPIVAKVTRDRSSGEPNQILISENDIPSNDLSNFKAILSTQAVGSVYAHHPSVYSVQTFSHLSDGDIVVVNPDGIINTLYRVNSYHNFLLVTERCNSNCLMCSQPPRDRNDIPYLFSIYKQLIPLIPKDCFELGITGGEPTLMGDLFFELLELLKRELPETEVHCLSNGRAFAWDKFSERLATLQLDRLMLGIPLYSDHYQVHDYIVQARDAFNQTMRGLYSLAVRQQRIEIRVVLHKQSIPRLTRLAKYIYKNLPFVEHVAFMGLEYEGYTPHNIDRLWADPTEYMDELEDAINFLSAMGMNVSIYNSQLCLLPQSLWKHNRKSISDWKNIYLDECSKCTMINECGGLFASGEKMHGKFIKAFA
jgi:His-Xaa-Ser system radical SAM maturase HxsC